MRLLSPVDNLPEAAMLVDAGADELYGGWVSAKWRRKYSMLGSANQRYFPSAQIEGLRELKGIVRAAHRGGAEFFLTLNAPYYTEAQYDDIMSEASRMADIGVDAAVVSDLGLILRLKEGLPELPVHLSTLQSVFNTRTAEFFSRLGISRMVLPRELTISEMAGIVRANKGVDFDAFIMVGKCPNIEGFCTFTHDNPELVWPCEEPYTRVSLRAGPGSREAMAAQAGWSKVNRRAACGLCAIPGLMDAGVTALKLVGRGGPAKMKIAVIKAVRQALELAGSGMSGPEYRTRAKEVYAKAFGGPCNPYVCYFPEMWGAGDLSL